MKPKDKPEKEPKKEMDVTEVMRKLQEKIKEQDMKEEFMERSDKIQERIDKLVEVHDEILEAGDVENEIRRRLTNLIFLDCIIHNTLKRISENPAEGLIYLDIIKGNFKDVYGIEVKKEMSPDLKPIYG